MGTNSSHTKRKSLRAPETARPSTAGWRLSIVCVPPCSPGEGHHRWIDRRKSNGGDLFANERHKALILNFILHERIPVKQRSRHERIRLGRFG